MNFNEYQYEAKQRSKSQVGIGDDLMTLMILGLGIAGEAGEVADEIKKLVRDKYGDVDYQWTDRVTEELGDVLWYLSRIAGWMDVDLEDVATTNLKKIKTIREKMG